MVTLCVLAVLKMVPSESLQGLQEWGKKRHGYLFSDGQPLPTSQREYNTSSKIIMSCNLFCVGFKQLCYSQN